VAGCWNYHEDKFSAISVRDAQRMFEAGRVGRLADLIVYLRPACVIGRQTTAMKTHSAYILLVYTGVFVRAGFRQLAVQVSPHQVIHLYPFSYRRPLRCPAVLSQNLST